MRASYDKFPIALVAQKNGAPMEIHGRPESHYVELSRNRDQ
jgi:hypothetical protein